MKFKQYCADKGLITEKEMGAKLEFATQIIENLHGVDQQVPVHSINDQSEIDCYLQSLFDRYLNQRAELCVNVSHQTRASVIQKLEKTKSAKSVLADRVVALDDAVIEVSKMLRMDSAQRFIRTDECQMLNLWSE